MNGPDLRFLAERASAIDDRTSDRLEEVHGRIATARERRRTAATFAAAALVVVLIVGLSLVRHDRDRTTPGPAVRPTTTATVDAGAAPPAPAQGTCWAVPPDRTASGEIESDDSRRVSCTAPHTTETVATFTIPQPTAEEAGPVGDSCGAEVGHYLDIYSERWIDAEAILFLPSQEEIADGASWVRCDAFIPGPWWAPVSRAPRRAATMTTSVRGLADQAPVHAWTCLAEPPTQDQQKVACDRPHAYEATGTLSGLGALASYPSAEELRAETQADCAPGVPRRLAGASVTAVWGGKDQFFSGLLRGVCFVFHADGTPLPPR